MRITLNQVQKYIEGRGMESVQIDGIPEGFSYKYPNVTIGDKEHTGDYIAYIPLSDWKAVWASDTHKLLELYNEKIKTR